MPKSIPHWIFISLISFTSAYCVLGKEEVAATSSLTLQELNRPNLSTLINSTATEPVLNLDLEGKCQQPQHENGNRTSSQFNSSDFWKDISEIKFLTDSHHIAQGHKKVWCKIKCVEGQWVGPLCSTEGENGRYQPLLKTCRLQVSNDSSIILSYHDHHKPLEAGSEVMTPHGTILLARCALLGKMKLLGVPSIQCRDGNWSHSLPVCLPTSPSTTNFTDDYPPAIVIHVASGAAGENAAGELVVRPNSILHFDCIFNRKIGKPFWTWTGTDQAKQYPAGWAMSHDERNWHYRISIYYVQPRDEGMFTCVTPKGHSNSISIVIRTILCPTLPELSLPLNSNIQGNYAGQVIHFSCSQGYLLKGQPNITCLTSGQWSDRPPTCEYIECPFEIEGADPRLEYEFLSTGYLGIVRFICPFGFKRIGPTQAVCQQNMTWSPSPPNCEEIQCPPLLPPLNGRIIDSGRQFAGDNAIFSCNKHFTLVGENVLTCTDEGTWSHPSPYCQLSCPHPGTPLNGKLNPNITLYPIGTPVSVSCNENRQLQGRPWIICQQDGTWSSAIGVCV